MFCLVLCWVSIVLCVLFDMILVCLSENICFFFFFKQKTAYEMRISDWSSDVCSSDLSKRRDMDRQVFDMADTLSGRTHPCARPCIWRFAGGASGATLSPCKIGRAHV